jgi:hypothetical protein
VATYAIAIDGVTKTLQVGWQITAQNNGIDTLLGVVYSSDASYRPDLGADIILTEDGTAIFGGNITTTLERRSDDVGIYIDITADGFQAVASRVYVTGTFAGGTLEDLLDFFETFLPTGFAVHPSQATGPAVGARIYDYKRLDDALNEASSTFAPGWNWTITPDQYLQMVEAATNTAPISITSNEYLKGDITLERSRQNYANRVYVLYGQGDHDILNERHDGDGVSTRFTLDERMKPLGPPFGFLTVHDGTPTVVDTPVGAYPQDTALAWTYDITTNEIVQQIGGVVTAPDYITIDYTGQFPARVVAEDAGEIASNGVWAVAVFAPDVFDKATAETLADAELARRLETRIIARFPTEETGLEPGQTLGINLSGRSVNTEFVITTLVTQSVANLRVLRYVTADSGAEARGLRETWSGMSSPIVLSSPGVTGGGAQPNNSPSTGWILLEEHSASASSSLDFTTRNKNTTLVGSGATFQTDFDHYIIQIIGLTCATTNVHVKARITTDGGSTWDSNARYAYQQTGFYSGSSQTYGVFRGSDDTKWILTTNGNALGNTTDAFGLNGTLHLMAPATAVMKRVYGQLSLLDSGTFAGTTGGNVCIIEDLFYTTAAAINGIRFYMETTVPAAVNIATGTIRIYGVR